MPRIITALLLIAGGLLGLFMTACGGLFTIAAIGDWIKGTGGGYSAGPIAIPSLLAGVFLLSRIFSWTRRFQQREVDKQAHLAMIAARDVGAGDPTDPGAGSTP